MEKILRKIGALAHKNGVKAYIVGGTVRDIVLKRENYDIDICVEENGIKFAEICANKLGGIVKKKSQFETALVILKDIRIDFSTTRREIYPEPGSLPVIEKGTLMDDLKRRDFTINAMAIKLNDKINYEKIIDPYGGRKDIEKRVVRVLHPRSFIQDPTRIFRAVRFATRLNFKIDKETLSLAKNSLKKNILNRVSGERIRNEFNLIVKEKKRDKIINRLEELKILDKLSLKRPEFIPEKSVYLLSLVDYSKETKRGFLSKTELKSLNDFRIIEKNIESLKKARLPSEVYSILMGKKMKALLLTASKYGIIKEKVMKYINIYRNVNTEIGGRELKNLGVKEGPIYKKLIREVLYAKLDGIVKTKADEIRYISKQYAVSNRQGEDTTENDHVNFMSKP